MKGGHDPRELALRSHAARRARKEREAEGEREAGKPGAEPSAPQPSVSDQVLMAIIADPKAHNSDRIRATEALRRSQEGTTPTEGGGLRELLLAVRELSSQEARMDLLREAAGLPTIHRPGPAGGEAPPRGDGTPGVGFPDSPIQHEHGVPITSHPGGPDET